MSQEFLARMQGRFSGMLRWSDLDALWDVVRAQPHGWYVSLVGTPPPQQAATAATLLAFLDEVDALLRSDHDCNYCGIVFADDAQQPTLIKIHDPHNVGGCGSGPVPPRWILSRMPPALVADHAPLPGNRKRWWQKLFGA